MLDIKKHFKLAGRFSKTADIEFPIRLGVWIRITMWISSTDGVAPRYFIEQEGEITEMTRQAFAAQVQAWAVRLSK